MVRPGCGTAGVVGAIRSAADSVAEHRAELTALDRAIGDGDHGENMARGFSAVVDLLDSKDFDTPGQVLKGVATTLISKVGGAAGPLFGTAFLRASSALGSDAEIGPDGVVTALRAATDGVVARGKAQLRDKTMVDALEPATVAAQGAAERGEDVAAVLRAAADAADAAAEGTAPLVAHKGRASYLGERSAGHVDPGARSVAHLLESFARFAAGDDRATSA